MGNQAMNPMNALREQQLGAPGGFVGPMIEPVAPEQRVATNEIDRQKEVAKQPRTIADAVRTLPPTSGFVGPMVSPAAPNLPNMASAISRAKPPMREMPNPNMPTGGFIPAPLNDMKNRLGGVKPEPKVNYANAQRQGMRKMMMF